MDNNFNQQQPIQAAPTQQPIPAAPVQGQPVQAAPQQQADPFAQGGMGQAAPQAPRQPLSFNLLELIGIILAGVGMLMVFLGTIFTCSCSAKKSMENFDIKYSTSAIFILTLFGILIAAAGVVLAILALKDQKSPNKAGKIAKVAVALGVFAMIYGILPTVTICGYNCSLNNAAEDAINDSYGSPYNDIYDFFK